MTPQGPINLTEISTHLRMLPQINGSLQRIAHALEALAKASDKDFKTLSETARGVAKVERP